MAAEPKTLAEIMEAQAKTREVMRQFVARSFARIPEPPNEDEITDDEENEDE